MNLNRLNNDLNKANSQWENNHVRILNYIHEFAQENCHLPTITKISYETRLSRPTIYKHLSGTSAKDYLGKQFKVYTLLIPEILGMLYSKSFNLLASDMETIRAAKTILEFLQFSSKYGSSVFIGEQNNHIIINNTTITQDQLQKLSPDKLSEIEGLINEAQETVKLN